MFISGVEFTAGSYPSALAFTGTPQDGDTVTIGDQVYTFKDTPAVAFDVATDTALDVAMQNLADAINGDLLGTDAHPLVRATVDTVADEVDLQAFGGACANSLALAATSPGTNTITAEDTTLGGVTGATLAAGSLGAWIQGFLDNAQIYSAAISDLEQNLGGGLL